jgi:hypothetical protein
MSKKISDLNVSPGITPAALLEVEQAGASYKNSVQDALDLIIIANVGAGATVFRGESPTNTFNLKSIIGGTNVTVDNNADDITINASTSSSPLTTKGDIWGFSTVDTRIPVGTNNQVLMADSAPGIGVKYALIANVNIDAAAAIAYSKLNLSGSISNGDLNSGVFSAITGIGTQSQDLDMNSNNIINSVIGHENFTNDVHADVVHVQVRNESGGAIARGDAVYVSGYSVGQDLPLVSLADSSSIATMPAFGIVEDVSIANNTNGSVYISGRLEGMNTGGFSAGDILYVSNVGTTGNTLTNVKPTGTDLIESVGEVLRSHASLGRLEIELTGVEGLPNIPTNNFWVGNGSAVPTANTPTQVTALLDVFTSGLKGLAPASGGGTTNFLRADGTWAVPPGGSSSPLTTKGDIWGYDSTDNRIPVGANNLVLMADSVQTLGVKYALIANANIDASAAIAFSKLATLTSGNILVGSAGNVATSVAMSGDIAIIASGATTIQVDAVDIPMLSATGTPDGTTFLRGDNTWAVPSGAGDMVLATAQTSTGKKTFAADATNAGFNLNNQVPSATVAGDIWRSTDNLVMRNNADTADITFFTTSNRQTAIVNSEIDAAAAIAYSKLASLTSGNVLVGSAGNVATSVSMSGDVAIIASGATTIQDEAVTLAKMAHIATARILGRVTAATGDVESLTGTQATTLLDVFTSGLKGLAPASGGGTTNFLRADGTWNAPAGGGDMVLADVQTVTGAKTFGTIGGAVGKFILAGSTSGSTIVNAAAVAGATTITFPGTTGTVALLSDLTGFFDTAGTGLTSSGSTVNAIGTTNRISVSADAIDIDAAYVGQASITTLGTITTGIWTGTDILFANIQQIATDRLLGRDTAATGDIEELTLDDTLEFTGAGGVQRAALTGDVTSPAGSNATTVANVPEGLQQLF